MKLCNVKVKTLIVKISIFIYVLFLSSSSINRYKSKAIFSPIIYSDIVNDKELGFINKEDIELSNKVSVYLNPSVQTWNLYANDLGNEAEHMLKIAREMFNILSDYSFLEVEGNLNEKGLSLDNSIKESNSKKRDIHLAFHSNAGGGEGCEVFTKGDYQFANDLYDGFVNDFNLVKRGVKNGNHLHEVKSINATNVALIEILFHDNVKEATFIANNHYEIAKSLSNALIKYVLINYK